MTLFRMLLLISTIIGMQAKAQIVFPFPNGLITLKSTDLLSKYNESVLSAHDVQLLNNNLNKTINETTEAIGVLQLTRSDSQGNALSQYFGSSFFVKVNDSIYLVTANHVIEDFLDRPENATLQLHTAFTAVPQKINKQDIISFSKQPDYAVIKTTLKTKYALELLDRPVEVGEIILSLGYPNADPNIAFSAGVAIHRSGKMIISSAGVLPGMSGGPSIVVDERGVIQGVIGINSSMGTEDLVNIAVEDTETSETWNVSVDLYTLDLMIMKSKVLDTVNEVSAYMQGTLLNYAKEHGKKVAIDSLTSASNLWVEGLYFKSLEKVKKDLYELAKTAETLEIESLFVQLRSNNAQIQKIYRDEQLTANSHGSFNPAFLSESSLAELYSDVNAGRVDATMLQGIIRSWAMAVDTSMDYFKRSIANEEKLSDAVFIGYQNQFRSLADIIVRAKNNTNSFSEFANQACFYSRANLVEVSAIPWSELKE